MPLTNPGATRCINGGGFISATASIWVSLHSAEPTDANELTGANMARVEIENSEVTVTDNAMTLTSAEDFPTPSQNIGSATHYGVYSAATGGTLLGWAPIWNENDDNVQTIVVNSGTVVGLPDDGLSLTIPLS